MVAHTSRVAELAPTITLFPMQRVDQAPDIEMIEGYIICHTCRGDVIYRVLNRLTGTLQYNVKFIRIDNERECEYDWPTRKTLQRDS